MVKLTTLDVKRKKVEALYIPVCEDQDLHIGKATALLIEKAKSTGGFKGEKDQILTLYNIPDVKINRVTFIGLGKMKELSGESLRTFAGKAVKNGIHEKLKQIGITSPDAEKTGFTTETVLTAICEGAHLGNYIFNDFKKEKDSQPLVRIDVMVPGKIVETHRDLPTRVMTVCDGTRQARAWVSTPSNHKRPETLAKEFQKMANAAKLHVTILNDKALKQQKFGAMLAVAAGSDSKPRLVIMEYAPRGAKKTIVLVGKGVTFDTGGINLKPTAGLDTMKCDMAGAAAVAATMKSVAGLKPKVRVIGLTPLVENMPSGSAIRPGDIVESFEGKTVEIGNTDAEGRLILIDAMAYARKTYKPDVLIDMATLTGACVVALGEKIAGLFSKDDDLAEKILEAGRETHERCWRLPLTEDYKELMKSKFADINNMSSSRWGGAITAALFLSAFAEDTCWAHIDIAGPAYIDKATDYCEPGGTGFGVRLLCRLIENLSA